ncbi:MAG: Uma2 family endonuclease [Myxococcota bacterium]
MIRDGSWNVHARDRPRHDTGDFVSSGCERAGGWAIQNEPEIHFGAEVLVPDVAGWRLSVADPFADMSMAYFTIVPQWVCEVLSKSTAKKDRDKKLPIYADAGVEHAWLIDLQRRMIEVFALREERYHRIQLHEGPGSFSAEPFEAAVDTRSLWVS